MGDRMRMTLDSEPDHYLRSLESISRRLAMIATCSFTFLVSLLVFFAMSFLKTQGFPVFGDISDILLISSMSFFVNIFLLFLFDLYKKRGDVLFNELSDEYEWRAKQSSVFFADSPPKDRPQLAIRVVMREFIKNSDLPLLQGESGVRWYAVSSAVIWIGTMACGVLVRGRAFY